jgi:hypothetical protein
LYQLQYKEQELHLPQDANGSPAPFPSFPAPLPATD